VPRRCRHEHPRIRSRSDRRGQRDNFVRSSCGDRLALGFERSRFIMRSRSGECSGNAPKPEKGGPLAIVSSIADVDSIVSSGELETAISAPFGLRSVTALSGYDPSWYIQLTSLAQPLRMRMNTRQPLVQLRRSIARVLAVRTVGT